MSVSPSPATTVDARTGEQLFVARQPVFNRELHVSGYELLFRSDHRNAFHHEDGSAATRQTVHTTLHVLGLGRLVADQPVLVNLTRELLLEGFYRVLPKERTVVELLEDVDPDAGIVAACKQLRAEGYQLALDDFVFSPRHRPLLAVADMVKVDLLQTSMAQAHALRREYARPGLTFLAEKVETYGQFEAARDVGFRLFQGYFFCKPEVMRGRDLPAMKQQCLLLLKQVTSEQPDFDQVERILKMDPSLSVKLLRYINSTSVGLRHRLSSIQQALVLLGTQRLRQWAALVAATALGQDKPQELVRTCLARARYCELAGAELGAVDQPPMDLFLLGLLSTLDALLDRPMAELLAELPIAPPIKEALLGGDSVVSKLHRLATACERGEWSNAAVLARFLQVEPARLGRLQTDALQWADRILACGG